MGVKKQPMHRPWGKRKKKSNTQLQGTEIKYLYPLANNLWIEMQLLSIPHHARLSDNISIASRCWR